jgi:hypothetical protein
MAMPKGFTRHIYAISGEHELDLMVDPNADLDGTFKAWDVEFDEMLSVNGWLFTIEEA